MEEDQDDTSSIPYIPFQLDYMRDVFHPKPFVKEKKEMNATSEKTVTLTEKDPTPTYTSIYGGIMDISTKNSRNQQGFPELSESERIQADQLYQRILEIEKKHEKDAGKTVIEDAPPTQFVVNQCGCPECCPRFQEDGVMHCELCNLSLENENWQHHSQSICHQLMRQNKTHVYVNPFMNPSSNAFKWMTAMGWKEGEGLGAEGQGRLEPIPTRLKNNHLGVGATDLAPLRITHTPHNDDADPNEDPAVTKERERLIKKFGLKRLRRIIKKYESKKREKEKRAREAWIRNEFRC